MSSASLPNPARRLPIGAELVAGGASFRVWAPDADRVEVLVDRQAHALGREEEGYHSGVVRGIGAGARYQLRLDGGTPLPDPASRFQPDGPHGPSEVIDPTTYRWRTRDWAGAQLRGQVLYELHVGTFSPDGTYEGVIRELDALRDVGITLIELMPVAEFPGTFGWGYDGVDLFAPWHRYGRPDDLRRLVDECHARGLAVLLDVVYNHFGPDGNYLRQFASAYFADHQTEWGEGLDYTQAPVRELFLSNVRYWLTEFHLDGLRLDAVHALVDPSETHIVADVVRAARQSASWPIVVIAESEDQRAEVLRDWGCDAVWNDDLHHSAKVALTGRNEAYLSQTNGTPQELISAARWGYLYQGQYYAWQGKHRGAPALEHAAAAFVNYLDNHDQCANTSRGRRIHASTSPGRYRAMTAYLLLIPGTPLLFQGQEYGAEQPFLYFADHHAELAALVREGRAKFLDEFPSTRAMRDQLDPPESPETFRRCVLDPEDRRRGNEILRLHKDLLALRRTDPTFRAQRGDRLFGAVLGPEAFLLRFFGATPEEDRLLIVNLGRDVHLRVQPEPLLAPPAGTSWATLWSSEEPLYGGDGCPPVFSDPACVLHGHAAIVLAPEARP